MAAGRNQKLKLLYLIKILSEETDDRHGLTMQEIIAQLNRYEVNADRKTLYRDLDELDRFGLDIIREPVGRNMYYHLGKRIFELPELKLLVDSVQSSKFISEKKSAELIKKLEGMASRHEARHLQRQVFLTGRVKTYNENIYYSVDRIHEAISGGVQIRFHYYRWTVDKKMELRNDGGWYQVSPWVLAWDDEYYYLIAYDSEDRIMKHYRVDKMLDIEVTEEPRDGEEEYQKFDAAKYAKRVFAMFAGEETRVTLEGPNELVGVVLDRFGKDITLYKKDEGHFIAYVDVAVSRHFLGWVIAVGEGLRITGPDHVVEQMKEMAGQLARDYLS